jgi:RimJ/RimL family protein N-acetyltransferase
MTEDNERGGVIRIQGDHLVLRPLKPEEVDAEWNEMVNADPMTIASLPDETEFKARLRRSGLMENGWLDLGIDLDGRLIGRIQTFVPPGRELDPGTFDIGIALRDDVRGRGHGTEALELFTDWLFREADAERVEAPTDPDNFPMRRVFEKVGWKLVGTQHEFEREWVVYAIEQDDWRSRQ